MNPIVSDKVYVCGVCGSSAVTVSALAGGEGSCHVCNWKGSVEELLVVPIEHTMGSPDQIKQAFHSELKRLFAKGLGAQLLQFLLRWGFVAATAPPQSSPAYKAYVGLIGRYVEAAARGAGNAILETREEVEKERRGGQDAPRA